MSLEIKGDVLARDAGLRFRQQVVYKAQAWGRATYGVNEDRRQGQRQDLWVKCHLETVGEEGRGKDPEKEQTTSRTKTRKGGLREVPKSKFVRKEAVATYVNWHRETEVMRLES